MGDDKQRRFATLVEPHFAPLYRAAVRLTRQRQDAEDLLQELCVRAYSRVDDLAAADSPLAWLLSAQYRLFIDFARRRRRSPIVAVADALDLTERTASAVPGPDRAAEGELGQRRVAHVWERLEAEQRALLALHAEGYGLDELAGVLGIAKNAVSARLHRARQRLATLLRGELNGKPSFEFLGSEP
jgi:RNA polymerase sigma-70 factor (ECF subfamily)